MKKTIFALLSLLIITVSCSQAGLLSPQSEKNKLASIVITDEDLAALSIEKTNNLYIFEGDIAYTELEVKQLISNYQQTEVSSTRGHISPHSSAYSSVYGPYRIWTDTDKHQLSYTFESNMSTSKVSNTQARNAFRDAVAVWMSAADITMYEVSSGGRISVRKESNPGSNFAAVAQYPYAGDLYNDSQYIIFNSASSANLTYDYAELRALYIHEIGHTLGLTHEHARPDAVYASSAHDFQGGYGIEYGAYDPSSTMHYYNNQRELSLGDRQVISFLYGLPDVKVLEGDFNGDNLTDILNIYKDDNKMTANVLMTQTSADSQGNRFINNRFATRNGSVTGNEIWLTGNFNGLDYLGSHYKERSDLAKIWRGSNGQMYCDVYKTVGESYSWFSKSRWANNQGGIWNGMIWMSGDFNGDGRDDLCKVWRSSGNGQMYCDVHLSNGSSFTMQRWANAQGGMWNGMNWMVGDFNGDNKDDLAKTWKSSSNGKIYCDVHLSTGSSFTMQRWANAQGDLKSGTKWVTGDFDGNGYDDLARLWNTGLIIKQYPTRGFKSNPSWNMYCDVHYSNGSSFIGYERWANGQGKFDDNMVWIAGNFDNDNRADIAKYFYDDKVPSVDVHKSYGIGQYDGHLVLFHWLKQNLVFF